MACHTSLNQPSTRVANLPHTGLSARRPAHRIAIASGERVTLWSDLDVTNLDMRVRRTSIK